MADNRTAGLRRAFVKISSSIFMPTMAALAVIQRCSTECSGKYREVRAFLVPMLSRSWGVVLHAFDLPCKRGVRPMAVKCDSGITLCRPARICDENNALLSPRRVWLFCLSQYPSHLASKQQFDTNQSTTDKRVRYWRCTSSKETARAADAEPMRKEWRKGLRRSTPDHKARPEVGLCEKVLRSEPLGKPEAAIRRTTTHAPRLSGMWVALRSCLETPQNEERRAAIRLTCKPLSDLEKAKFFRIPTYEKQEREGRKKRLSILI